MATFKWPEKKTTKILRKYVIKTTIRGFFAFFRKKSKIVSPNN